MLKFSIVVFRSYIFILFISILPITNALAQETVKLYRILNQDMNMAKPLSYLSLFNGFGNLEDPEPALSTEEGQEGFLVEANFFIKFPLWEKRYYEQSNIRNNSIKPFFGYGRIYIDYGFSSRVAKKVDSSPSLPVTNRYGIRWDKAFSFKYKDANEWTSVRVWDKSDCDEKDKVYTFDLDDKDVEYKFWYATAYAHHYSNGGDAGVLEPTQGIRNNYVSGDHSTSFVRLSVGKQVHNGIKSHRAFEIGYQAELGDAETFFSFPVEQQRNYGRHRIVGNYQYIFGFKEGSFFEYLKLRGDGEFILGNLQNFPYDKKYRLNTHIFVVLPMRPTPGVGFLLHAYIGRDYLNIRYDNPIITLQVGLSLDINRYSLNIFERITPSK